MKTNNITHQKSNELTLVLGATGKTGRRVAKALEEKRVPVRLGSRFASPAFDWQNEAGWAECLQGVKAVYLNYAPDLAVPGATDSIRTFVKLAEDIGVKKVVLLSGRGESEAQACEQIVMQSSLSWTVIRASWFNQNFSEGLFLNMVLSGEIVLPISKVQEPFVDVDDIVDIAVAALTEADHEGELYEVTGPRLMTFSDLADELTEVTGCSIRYIPIPHESFINGLKDRGASEDVVWMVDYLFSTVFDGRNAYLTDGVQRALGRPPKDFKDYAREIAVTEVWQEEALTV